MLAAENELTVLSENPELSANIRRVYYSDLGKNPFNALKSSVASSGIGEAAACVKSGGVVYSAAKGGARVDIVRDGATATILQSLDENVIIASGFPKEKDLIILHSKKPEVTPIEIEFGQPPILPKKNIILDFLKKLPSRRIYVRPGINDEVSSQSKKLTFSVAIILILVLGVSIGFGIRQKKINDLKNKYEGILQEAQNEADQAIGLASTDPEKSRELFIDSRDKLRQIEALNVKDPKVDALKDKINQSRESILGEYAENPELFLDLSLLSSGFKGDSVSASGGNIYVLDKNGKKVVSVVISTKKSKVVAGPSTIDEAFDLASYEDRVFVLGGDGIYEVSNTKNKVVDKVWGGDALIKAFAGNLYVLDKSGNAIYRYAGSGSSFSDKQDWLAAGTRADFSDARQWVIDGSVYILFPNSKILKFSQGSPQSFKVSRVTPEIGSIDAIYADPDDQYVYLLDKAGRRVVVTDKKGSYKAQYQASEIGNATNLVVSEADKKIILLTGDKLESIELKNL